MANPKVKFQEIADTLKLSKIEMGAAYSDSGPTQQLLADLEAV